MFSRLLRAVILASLAALVCATRVFTATDWLRAKVVQAPEHAVNGVINITTRGFPQLDQLPPPVAVIARLNHLPRGTQTVSIAIDDAAVCDRHVEGEASRRIDCAAETWRAGIEHRVTIHGPPVDWTLDYLELATHHGNTNGAHYLVVLPRSSDRYVHVRAAWIGALWLLLAAVLILPAPALPKDWTRVVYRLAAALVWLALTACLVSSWVSEYRVVVAAHTFALWLALLFAPRLWTAGAALARWLRLSSTSSEYAARRAPLAAALAAITAIVVMIIGVTTGTFEIAGADSYGYVSQAHLLATGTLHIEQPFVRDWKWPLAADAAVPLGYRLAGDGTSIGPIYPPGYPMAMALAERVAGRDAVFYVVPFLGGLAVWATFLMGRRLAGPWIGLAAATLLAVSPSFLFQLQAPMSDVPATAWWALCLACVVSEQRTLVLAGGLAAGAAILTRPNLAPLGIIPWALLLWPTIRDRKWTGRSTQGLILFSAGAFSGVLIVAIINGQLWGSALTSGYGSVDTWFAWKNLAPNLARYPRWIFETETPAVFVAPLAPFVLNGARTEHEREPRVRAIAVSWLAFCSGVFLSYLFYQPYDGWIWLRFVLPAFPPLLVLMTATLSRLFARVSHGTAATAAAVALLCWYECSFASAQGMFHLRDTNPPNGALGEYIDQRLPDDAVFVSRYQSGSVRYYSGRITVRWDVIPQEQLDAALDLLRQRGYHPYIVVEEVERAEFADRFRGRSALADLDWTPRAEHASSHVRIYDPLDKTAPTHSPPTSDIVR